MSLVSGTCQALCDGQGAEFEKESSEAEEHLGERDAKRQRSTESAKLLVQLLITAATADYCCNC